MDEKEVLAEAAEELTRQGDIEEVTAVLQREKTEAFPLFLFIFTVIKDILDFPIEVVESGAAGTGVGAVVSLVIYILWLLFTIPLWVWTFIYMWGKIRRLQRYAFKYGFKGLQVIMAKYEKQILARCAFAGVSSITPILNMLFPQCLLILFAHNRYNKIVSELLVAADIFGKAASGNALAIRRASEEYASYVASNIVREADVSGRIGERFGSAAEFGARRLERNIVRQARKRGGRAIARGAVKATREINRHEATRQQRVPAPGRESQTNVA